MTLIWRVLKTRFGRRLVFFGLMTVWRMLVSAHSRQILRRITRMRHRAAKRDRLRVKAQDAVARVRA